MEFVTNGTNGTCVKYFLAWVRFSTINAKNYPFLWNWPNLSLIFNKITGVTWVEIRKKTENSFKIDEKHPTLEIVDIRIFSGKIENFGNLTRVKSLTNSMCVMGSQFWNKSSLFHLSTFRALTQLPASPRWSPCSSKCIFAGQLALVLHCWIGVVSTLLLIPGQVLQQYSSTFLICLPQICVSLVSLSFHFLQSWLFDYFLLFCF